MDERRVRTAETPATDSKTHNLLTSDLLIVIHNSKTEVANKIEEVAVDVTLLHMDLRNVSDRVTMTDENEEELHQEVRNLRTTVSTLQKLTARLDEHIEDSEGRSRRNNLHFFRIP
ncbi:hypothetical protein NDU88_005154 [Pleurodeles waltl]|uniref:Uncharacterized protein n=1 Tax=Pleurodeles waltl TaxID=8319 RepID=A0AAV7W9X5_PLEWA|nr:hypothetical protein NDU88_005154 [Pleurodeles waltl]